MSVTAHKFSFFNYTLWFGQVGLENEVPFRISALHYITSYALGFTNFSYVKKVSQAV